MHADKSDEAKLRHVKLVKPVYLGEVGIVESEPLTFDIDPHALSLQGIRLASGEEGFESANIVVHAKDGAPVVDDLAKLGFSLEKVERIPLPEQPPPVRVSAEELSASGEDLALTHFADDASIGKGKRRLSVKWTVSLAGAEIASRLGEKAAGAQGDRVLKAERLRVAHLFPCGGVTLVTNRGTRAAVDAAAAAKTCAALDTADGAEFTVNYDLDRYEIPIALVYVVGKTKTFSPIASAALSKLDPR